MKRPISIGQIWLLEQMVLHDGLLYVGIHTTNCPEPVGMSTLRGLEQRGLCEQTTTSGVFSITASGREQYHTNKDRLSKAVSAKRQKELEADEKYWS